MERELHREGLIHVNPGAGTEEETSSYTLVPEGRPGHYTVSLFAEFGGSEPAPGSVGFTFGTLRVSRRSSLDGAAFVAQAPNVAELALNKPHTIRDPEADIGYSSTLDNRFNLAEVDLEPIERLDFEVSLSAPDTRPGTCEVSFRVVIQRTGE